MTMEKMSFLDYLKKFQPGEPIKDVKDWIDALVNYHAASIASELRIAGDESVLRLRKIGDLLEDCIHYLFTHDSEVCESYLIDEIRPWLTQYSQKHLKDADILFLHGVIVDENGNEDYLKDHFPWMYGNDPEEDFSDAPFDDYEDDSFPLLSQEDNLTIEQEEELAQHDNELFDWYLSQTEEELVEHGFSIGEEIFNPMMFGRERVLDALKRINDKVVFAKSVIKDYLEWHKTSLRCQSMVDYAEAIAPIIDGQVFNEPIDGRLLEDVLSAKGRCGFSIKGRMNARWARIIWEIYQDGPEECRSDEWLADIVRVWNLQESIKKRPYDAPLKRPDEVLDKVSEVLRNLHP